MRRASPEHTYSTQELEIAQPKPNGSRGYCRYHGDCYGYFVPEAEPSLRDMHRAAQLAADFDVRGESVIALAVRVQFVGSQI